MIGQRTWPAGAGVAADTVVVVVVVDTGTRSILPCTQPRSSMPSDA